MQRRTRDVLIRQRTQIINALRDASGRARVRGGAGQRRGQRIARARDGRSWKKPRRVVAKVEWHPGELYPRVGFIVTNLSRPAERVVASTTSAGRASNGSSKARERSSGRGCHAARSPPTLRAPQAGQRPLHRAPWRATSIFQIADQPAEGIVPRDQTLALPEAISLPACQALADNLANFMRTVVPRSAAESGAVATSACVRSPMVMCSRATDGRSASKCQGKWPDQTLDHRPDCQWWRQSSEPRTPLGKTPDIRKNLRQFGSHPGNPGSKLSCA